MFVIYCVDYKLHYLYKFWRVRYDYKYYYLIYRDWFVLREQNNFIDREWDTNPMPLISYAINRPHRRIRVSYYRCERKDTV